MELLLHPEHYAVCRLGPAAADPGWGEGGGLRSLTRSAEELSLVCVEAGLPANTGDAMLSRGWRCLRVAGSLDFSMVGVLSALASPLAAAGVSIFAVSTYDTDYLLVRADALAAAVAALEAAGQRVTPLAG
jgi:hypothetical protein